MKTKTITTIPHFKPIHKLKKRVAAYARVSSEKDAMLHSLSAQVSAYSEKIQSRPYWAFAGVYVDEGITGTKITRQEFQRMMEDARSGKIDLILTKSISRFARNTVTLLESVRELKILGVAVYFERENINSLTADGELMLTLLASFAQEESRSVSENCKWRIRKDFSEGKLFGISHVFGYHRKNGMVTIVPDQAKTVREIFERYATGELSSSIAKDLNKRGVKTFTGTKWRPKIINYLIRNVFYTGNAILQKTFVTDHLSKHLVTNKGELPMYYVENSHEAIIPMELFEKVRAVSATRNYAKDRTRKKYPFSHLIRCENCGENYIRRVINGVHKWQCYTYCEFGSHVCHAKFIPEDTLIRTTTEVLGLSEFDPVVLEKQIDHISVPADNKLVFYFHDGRVKKRVWKDRSRSESWTPEMREKARQRRLEEERKKRCAQK